MSTQHHYPADLSDRQWQMIAPLLPCAKQWEAGRARPPCNRRLRVSGILYLTKTGCQWPMLPKEFGHLNTVFSYFNRWRVHGVWPEAMGRIRELERQRQGRSPEPSAGCAEGQRLKAPTQGHGTGFDGGKEVKG